MEETDGMPVAVEEFSQEQTKDSFYGQAFETVAELCLQYNQDYYGLPDRKSALDVFL